MALVSDGFFGSISVADNGRQVSTLQYDLTAVLIATAITDMATIVAALAAVTEGEVLGYRVGEKFIEDAAVLPAAGVQIQDKASLTVSLEATIDLANIKIPAPVIGIFTGASGGGADVIDISDADLLTYVAVFQTGNEATVARGQVLDALLSGKRIHAKSNLG